MCSHGRAVKKTINVLILDSLDDPISLILIIFLSPTPPPPIDMSMDL
jgi:hypothetical protein